MRLLVQPALAICVLISGLAARASTAQACGPCDCPGRWPRERVYPRPGSDTPPNVRFLVDLTGAPEARVSLKDAAGSEVALIIERALSTAEQFWVSPKVPLTPMAAYELSLDEQSRYPFVAAAASNDRPPELGALTLSTPAGSAFCEPYAAVSVELASFVDQGQPYNRGVLQVDFGSSRGLFPLYALSPTRQITIGDGDAACFGGARVEGLQAGVAQRVSLTFWDSTGHSTRLDDVEITPQRIVTGGCGLSDDAASSDAGSETGQAPGQGGTTGARDAETVTESAGCQLGGTGAPWYGAATTLLLLGLARVTRRRGA